MAEAQARFYGRIFRVVLKHPGVVTRVTFWGTHDGASWLNFYPVVGRTNHPLLWTGLKPKPAFGAVRRPWPRRDRAAGSPGHAQRPTRSKSR